MTDRVEQIRQIVEDTRRRRGDGETVSDDNITSANPSLMPELESELKKLAVIEAARNQAQQATESTCTAFQDDIHTEPTDLDDLQSSPTVEVPDFELLACVGRGGFGAVWVARHRLHGEFCAVKVVSRHRDIELDGVRIYRQRAKDHPGLVPIEHVGETDQCFYYVMPLADDVKGSTAIRGPEQYEPMTLDWCLKNLPPPPIDEVISLGVELLDSIAILHRAGLAHQDIKPANVMMFGGRWKLGDLGLLSRNDQLAGDRGTVAFWPPEGTHSPTADLYALGKTLYLLATGRQLDLFDQSLDEGLGIPGDQQLVERLGDVISHACHADVAQRFRSAEEMRAALLEVTSVASPAQPKQRRQPAAVVPGPEPDRVGSTRTIVGLLAGVVVIGLLVMAGQWFFGPHDMPERERNQANALGGRGDDESRGRDYGGEGSRGGGYPGERSRGGSPGGEPLRPGYEVSGCLAISCNRPARGPDGRDQALKTLPSPIFVGDRLRVEINHQIPTTTFVLRLRTNGRVELLHPPEGSDTVAKPIERLAHDIEIKPDDVGSQPNQLSGFVVIASESVSFAEWRANLLDVTEGTSAVELSWKSPVSVVGWKYNSSEAMRLKVLHEDATSRQGNPQVRIDARSGKAGGQLRDFCEHLKSAPNSINVWAIVFPCLNPES